MTSIVDPMMPSFDASRRGLPDHTTDELVSQLSQRKLTPSQQERLHTVISDKSQFNIHDEIKAQYLLVKQVRSNFLDPDGSLRSGLDGKEIQSIFSQFNSFMGLYLRAMEKLDKDKQLSEIEAAVNYAISQCSKEVQDTYLAALKHGLDL